MEPAIIRNDSEHRFETSVDGTLCVLDYQLEDGVLQIQHVGVPENVGGRGIAGALTRLALDTARAEHWQVIPHCSYAAAWIRRHPEYADLVVH